MKYIPTNIKALGLSLSLSLMPIINNSNTSDVTQIDNDAKNQANGKLVEITERISKKQTLDSLLFEVENLIIGTEMKVPKNKQEKKEKEFIQSAFELGYIPSNHNYNRHVILKKSGEEFLIDRERLSLTGISKLLNIKKGNLSNGTENNENFRFIMQNKDIYQKIASEEKISPYVIAAITVVESKGNPFVMSESNCIGLQQLSSYMYKDGNLSNGKKIEAINPFSPFDAIKRSAEYINVLTSRYKNLDIAVTAYNQGESVIDKHIAEAKKYGVTDPKDIIKYRSETAALSDEGKNFHVKFNSAMNMLKKMKVFEGTQDNYADNNPELGSGMKNGSDEFFSRVYGDNFTKKKEYERIMNYMKSRHPVYNDINRSNVSYAQK